MNTCMKRNRLLASAAILGLLAAMQAPLALASEEHQQHQQPAAQANPPASAPAKGQAADQAMDHGNMGHGTMNHADMQHEGMQHGEMPQHDDNAAAAGSQHDH